MKTDSEFSPGATTSGSPATGGRPRARSFETGAPRRRRQSPVKLRKALYILEEFSLPLIYGPEEQRDIAKLVNIRLGSAGDG
jgi:hypothetical protein